MLAGPGLDWCRSLGFLMARPIYLFYMFVYFFTNIYFTSLFIVSLSHHLLCKYDSIAHFITHGKPVVVLTKS